MNKTSSKKESSVTQQKGLADQDQPGWAPPESKPEPRPADPVLNPSQQPSFPTKTNSPA